VSWQEYAKLRYTCAYYSLLPSQRGQGEELVAVLARQGLMPREELIIVSFSLKMLRPAKKELEKMDKDKAQKIYDHIEQLKSGPFRPRIGMNIDKVAGKQKPPAYRLKIGRIRVEYFVDGQMIVIFNIFMKKRKSDYR
jgi:mRNA-degrading endonuclease RelE of RelBE toxin-antitoxin system